MTRVIAVRHGETDWNRNGRMQGWAPVPLNETGREQAVAAGRWLSERYEFDRVLSSDLVRTRQTTELLLEDIDAPEPDFEPAWRERNLGVYQGLTYEDVESRFPEFGLGEEAYRTTDATPEGGESLREVADRVTGRFDKVLNDEAETTLVVTHGGPLRILFGHVKELGLTEALTTHRPQNCGITEFRAESDPVIVCENATDWQRS